MKAISRLGAGLLSLLVLGSVSQAYVWVSPVFKTPYPQAPDVSTSAVYTLDPWGRVIAVHYNLMPPCRPFQGILPGPTGHALQTGTMSCQQLLSKDGLSIGVVPLLGQKQSQNRPYAPNGVPGAGLPELGRPGNGPGQYPTLGRQDMRQFGNTQQAYTGIPSTPYPMGSMYSQPGGSMTPQRLPIPGPTPMPYGTPPMPSPYGAMPMPMNPYGAMPMPCPYGPMPSPYGITPMNPFGGMTAPAPMNPYGQPVGYRPISQDPRTGIWLVQNTMPIAPPSFPGANAGPGPGFMPFTPMQPFMDPRGNMSTMSPFGPMQSMTPPMMEMAPMQLPRMEMTPPPEQKAGGSAYPTHPFTRSPRDFFMWGENMDEERARGNRPFPVP